MQVTLTKQSHRQYMESPQTNPIRFLCMHRIGEDEFVNTTNVFKCKDYFNDFVAHAHGAESFTCYQMPSNAAVFDEHGGLYVMVVGVVEHLQGNLERVLKPFADKWGARITYTSIPNASIKQEGTNLLTENQKNSAAMLWFSPECFVSTFRISTLTLFLRNCNIKVKLENYDAIMNVRQLVVEACWYPNQYQWFKDQQWVFTKQKEFWWWNNNNWNSTTHTTDVDKYIIHNNGQYSWVDSLLGGNLLSYNGIYDFRDTIGKDIVIPKHEVVEEVLNFDEWEEEDEEECNETT